MHNSEVLIYMPMNKFILNKINMNIKMTTDL